MHIVYYPDPVLLRPARAVEGLPDDLDELIAEMRKVMALERGIGLAAPQVGVSRRVLLCNTTGESADEICLINPKIVRFHGEKEWGEEGCLSFPGIYGSVLRHTRVDVEYVDREGNPARIEAEDLVARVLQHEIDHLDGILFVTKMREADQLLNRQKLRDLRERFEGGVSEPPFRDR